MPLIGLDFETYYDKDYSLRKIFTEEYILSPLFEVQGCAVWQDGQARWLSEIEFRRFVAETDWSRVTLVGHNLKFDAAILAWRYGKVPAGFIDTLAIANVYIRPYTGSSSLEACCEFMGLPAKSGVLDDVKGLRTVDILQRPGLWEALGAYAIEDIKKSVEIARRYLPYVTPIERRNMDWTVRNSLSAKLHLDEKLIEAHLQNVELELAACLLATGIRDPKTFSSTRKFAEHLYSLGVQVEYKAGKDEEVPAVSKEDAFMQALLVDPDPAVRFAAEARLVWASTIERTRSLRLLRHSKATGGRLLVGLQYGAAHTMRYGGTNKMNLQNLGRKSLLRKAIKARPGEKLVIVDASQIECRLVGWFARCEPLLTAFRQKIDVYCQFGSGLYGEELRKETHPVERQVSKVSVLQLGYASGHAKLHHKLSMEKVDITEARAREIVHYYRRVAYPEIPRAWRGAESALRRAIQTGQDVAWNGCLMTPIGIQVPSGGWMLYDQLSLDEQGVPQYWSPRYKSWQRLYGGAIMENLCQRTARDVITEVQDRYLPDVVLQVHDELVQAVPAGIAQARLDETIAAMSATPAWLPGIPLDAEGKVSDCYDK